MKKNKYLTAEELLILNENQNILKFEYSSDAKDKIKNDLAKTKNYKKYLFYKVTGC
jgi:hypothetical protein